MSSDKRTMASSDEHSYGCQPDPQQEDPWPIEGYPDPPQDHEPTPPPPPSPSRPRPPLSTPKGDDCCRQIMEVLRCIPGIDEECLRLHKPKTPPKVTIANLCGALPMKDRLGPIMLLVIRRFRDGVSPGNALETWE